MNDRFKFRFYHYETETMYEVKAICFEGRPIVTVQYNPVLKFPLDSGELMQCTGLKDKNGKLIYEGDILYCMLNCPRKSVVKFYRNAFCLNENGSYSEDIIFSDKCCEVVGNIHENKELLK